MLSLSSMISILDSQQLPKRIDEILRHQVFSSYTHDVVLHVFTDDECFLHVKNRFSIHKKRRFSKPVGAFCVHLYNHDLTMHFSRLGNLARVAYFPDHSGYVEVCGCCAGRHVAMHVNWNQRIHQVQREKCIFKVILAVKAQIRLCQARPKPELYPNNQYTYLGTGIAKPRNGHGRNTYTRDRNF